MDITIRKAILHILDSTAAMPVFSQRELDVKDEEVEGFITSHVTKIYSDLGVKDVKFLENSKIKQIIGEDFDNFSELSMKISNKLFSLMKTHTDIPGADLLVAVIDIDDDPCLAVIKYNYKKGYTHFVEYNDSGVANKLMVHSVILASESQRVDEAALIMLDSNRVLVLEKPFLIDGERENYFSKLFLSTTTELSKKESMQTVSEKAIEIAEKYYDDDFEKPAMLKEAIYNNLSDDREVNLDNIAEQVFGDDKKAKTEYLDNLKYAGVKETIRFEKENPEKPYSKHKIKTDCGIEINIPMELYKNKDTIEFINNPNGTISIMIKQIMKITNK